MTDGGRHRRRSGGDGREGPRSPIVGPRRAALESRRQRQRKRSVVLTGAAGVAAAALAAGLVFAVARTYDPGSAPPAPDTSSSPVDTTTTTLLFGTRERRGTPETVWMALAYLDEDAASGGVIYIPAHTAVEVPGRGLQGVGDALSTGGIPLLLITTENMLGVEIDRYIELSDSDARVLFEATGPISVDVPAEVRVPAGRDQARLIFTQGQQRLPSTFLVQLLYTIGLDGDDVELGSRHIAFWSALFETFTEDPEGLAGAIEKAGPALTESDATAEEHASFMAALASLGTANVQVLSLPVNQISVGGSELYATDEDELTSFITDALGVASRTDDEIRVQVLNGNGIPGIGQEVAEKLIGRGFRVILSGNAQRLNYPKTLIITYDGSREGQALAEQARELLGVGEVQIAAQRQGIVDLTIVVGKDFELGR